MCAIVGCIPGGEIQLDWLRHRGPDGACLVKLPKLTLGQARLAILELSERAAQPKWSADGRVLLSYNGEIYNYPSLGSPDETSDTVALVEWLAKQGAGFNPGRLDGMYAFAAYFPEEELLTLARDPAGIKPLYIAISPDGSQLGFASEIKGFFGLEWFSPRPNPDVAVQREFLQFGYAFPGVHTLRFLGTDYSLPLVPTLLDGVFQLCPGQKLAISCGGGLCSTFFAAQASGLTPLAALEQSVQEQSMSDVEVGVQLSGGIDSSLVAWQYARGHPEVHGFYVSVPGEGLNEDRWAVHAAERLSRLTRFTFHQVKLTPAEIRRVLPAVVWGMDEPAIRHPNAIGVYLLSEHVRQETAVKVLLTGEGADEMFGGYSWQDGRTMEGYDKSRWIFDLGGHAPAQALMNRFPEKSILERQLAFDREVYLPAILARQDRMSMAWSLETRVPFLSNRFLVQPAPVVPGKRILKRQAAEVFGTEFANRAKCGFGFPIEWLAEFEPPAGSLDWLRVSVQPGTPFQRWAWAALGFWAETYLHGGWKARTPSAPSKTRSQTVVRDGRQSTAVSRSGGSTKSSPPQLSAEVLECCRENREQFESLLAGKSAPSAAPVIAREGNWATAIASGCVWRLDSAQFLDSSILSQGVFELESLRLLRPLIKPGMVTADVGANFGYYSLLLSQWVGADGRVHAFEPSGRFRTRLNNHLDVNGCQNVTVHAFGLSDKQQQLTLYGGSDSATLGWHDDALKPVVQEKVDLQALDACSWIESLPRLDFIKIDIDGCEPLFLEGAQQTLRRFRPILLMEFMQIGLQEFGYDVVFVAQKLNELGYVLFSEKTGQAWTNRAEFLRETMNCSHSVNVFCLPAPASNAPWQCQRAFLIGAKSRHRSAGRPAQALTPGPAPGSAVDGRAPQKTAAAPEAGPVEQKLTDRNYWDLDRSVRFAPSQVNGTAFSKLFDQCLPHNPDFTCAEIGAYPGNHLCDLAKRKGYRPVAIEYSEHADHIRQQLEHNGIANPRVIQQDFFKVRGEQFDVVCSFGFVEHFENSQQVIAQHFELLKPGGYLMISVPRIDGFQGLLYELVYTPEVWRKIASAHNAAIMNLHALRRVVAAHTAEFLFADYFLGDTVYFNWTEPFVKPEMRWLVRYLNEMQRSTQGRVPPSAFHSPHIVVIARKPLAPPAPSRSGELAQAALAALQKKDFGTAEKLLETVVAQDPDYYEAVCVLADLRTRQGNVEGAHQILAASSGEMPSALEIKKRLALSHQARGNWNGAELALLECLSWKPREAELLRMLRDLYRARNRAAEAGAVEHTLSEVEQNGAATAAPAVPA